MLSKGRRGVLEAVCAIGNGFRHRSEVFDCIASVAWYCIYMSILEAI